MADYLLNTLTAALQITFLHVLFWEGMLLEGVGQWLRARLPRLVCKPLFDCLICMTSIWGVTLFVGSHGSLSWQLIPFLFTLGGIHTVLSLLIGRKLLSDELG